MAQRRVNPTTTRPAYASKRTSSRSVPSRLWAGRTGRTEYGPCPEWRSSPSRLRAQRRRGQRTRRRAGSYQSRESRTSDPATDQSSGPQSGGRRRQSPRRRDRPPSAGCRPAALHRLLRARDEGGALAAHRHAAGDVQELSRSLCAVGVVRRLRNGQPQQQRGVQLPGQPQLARRITRQRARPPSSASELRVCCRSARTTLMLSAALVKKSKIGASRRSVADSDTASRIAVVMSDRCIGRSISSHTDWPRGISSRT